jgi:hypothetical protein
MWPSASPGGRLALVGEASRRFDLSPLEEEWMIWTFAGRHALREIEPS